jgi:hypothetical protein
LRGNAYATIISVSLKNGFRFAKKRWSFPVICNNYATNYFGEAP